MFKNKCMKPAMYESTDLTHSQVAAIRDQLAVPRGQTAEPIQKFLKSQKIFVAPNDISKPYWVDMVSKNRAFFCTTVFRFRDASSSEAICMKPVFSRQRQPIMVGFVKLEAEPVTLLGAETEAYVAAGADAFAHIFKTSVDDWCFTDSSQFGTTWTLEVMPNARYIGHCLLESDDKWYPYHDVHINPQRNTKWACNSWSPTNNIDALIICAHLPQMETNCFVF